ncbi:DUF6624 domain-containing protein [Lewinella sp. W8]|uniref:DUF6624 domain-containing protein n=1 Tax=Lewinella sp. W8 TaxID=2528208 RepID=UPI0010687164|nr:DUF6624 domain-containing protein [Lewinella sp. W8]MTB52426.1 hypothetical protein [Lewinella sp. W8]
MKVTPTRNWKKIFLITLLLVFSALAVFLFVNRDKFTYVGSIDIVEVDCATQAQTLEEVFERDQRVRKEKVPFKEFAQVDHENQELVVSILEKCGMPTLEEVSKKELYTVWLVLQHSRPQIRAKYFPLIEEAVNRGELGKSQYALMKDRILMDQGEPQLYGSQIKNGELYDLQDPETVNERRAEMGLEPLKVYLKRFDINYDE